MAEPLLKLSGIAKDFGAIRVLDNVDFEINAGEVVAVVGQNGAGKSTFMNIIAGVLAPTRGQIRVEGQEVRMDSPRAASQLGIRMVHQELSLFPSLTIMENLLIGDLPKTDFGLLDWAAMREKSREKMARIGLNLDPLLRVGQVSIAQQQMIEICREVDDGTRVLILDEPTSAIGREEVATLFSLIRRLKTQRAVAFIYISHRLDEVLTIADRIYTLRDGVVVSTVSTHDISHENLIRTIIGEGGPGISGRSFDKTSTASRAQNVLEVRGLTSDVLRNVDLNLRKGEVLGLAGLTGSGRTEILKSIYGASPISAGAITAFGSPFGKGHDCHDALRRGICLIPENRKEEGLNLGLSVRFNTSLASIRTMTNRLGLIDSARELRATRDQMLRYRTKASSPEQPLVQLSGGNQQKVCLSKWTVVDPKIVLLDEPTKGVDIGAKEEIFKAIASLAETGVSLIVVSSEFRELLRLCDRILVLRNGAIIRDAVVDPSLTEEALVFDATGGADKKEYERPALAVG